MLGRDRLGVSRRRLGREWGAGYCIIQAGNEGGFEDPEQSDLGCLLKVVPTGLANGGENHACFILLREQLLWWRFTTHSGTVGKSVPRSLARSLRSKMLTSVSIEEQVLRENRKIYF